MKFASYSFILSPAIRLVNHLRTLDFCNWDPPFDGSENTNYEAYSSRLFILYTTCLLDHSFHLFALEYPATSRAPKIWNLKPNRHNFSSDIRLTSRLRTLDFALNEPSPRPQIGPIWYTTRLLYQNFEYLQMMTPRQSYYMVLYNFSKSVIFVWKYNFAWVS